MKRILFAALLLVAYGAQADGLFSTDEETKWRAGGGAAFGDFEDDDGIIDDSEVGFTVFGQYQFNKWFGLEAAYLNTGDFKGDLGTGANKQNLELSYRGFHMAAVGYAPIAGDDISLFGKIGFFDFDTDLSVDNSIDSSGHTDGAMAGIGAVVSIADNVGIRAEADIYDVDDADFWTAIIGLEYHFGRPKN